MKTPGLYQVPEPRNLLNFIFWSIFRGFFGGGGGDCGGFGGSNVWGVVKDEEVDILDVLPKIPGLHQVPELRYS